jgi:hypothetical protein
LGKRKLLNERWLSIERKRKLLNEITESKQKETIVETPCERAEPSESERRGKVKRPGRRPSVGLELTRIHYNYCL